jgi:N-methylhydantoinase B
MPPIDPITLEVLTEGLISIVREMRATVLRSARSVAIYEGKDFSCALFDPSSQLIAQSEDIGAHVVPLPRSVQAAMAEFSDTLAPGDLILMNDPYRTGTHLNDVTMIYPVFEEGKLIFFPAVVEHWADVGGMTPGSLSGLVTEIYQEGLRIPPLKIMERGVINKPVMDLILLNMRVPDERRGDFHAGVAALRTAERRIREMVSRYGLATLLACTELNMNRSEARMRGRIAALPAGEYRAEDYLEVFTDGKLDPVILTLTLTIQGSSLIADFTGSSEQVAAPANSTLAVTAAAVFIALKSILDPQVPMNHGTFRPVTVTAPPGTIVNAVPHAPVGSQGEIRKRVIGVVSAALAQVIPDFVAADAFRTSFHNLIGGTLPRTGKQFVHYEWASGGNGAFAEGDGPSAMASIDWGEEITLQSAEVLESRFPLVVEFSELAPNSGGEGRRRGGLGMRRHIRVLGARASYSLLSDAAVIPPFGTEGGHSGTGVDSYVIRDQREVRFSPPGKVSGFQLATGDIVVMQAPGGGGYGDPLERSPEEVRRDVVEGYITRELASDRYGVVLRDDLSVDTAATRARRTESLEARRHLVVVNARSQTYAKGTLGKRRLCQLNPIDANSLRIRDGDLVELAGRRGVPLRAWAAVDTEAAPGAVVLDERGCGMLGVAGGSRVHLRRVPTPEDTRRPAQRAADR